LSKDSGLNTKNTFLKKFKNNHRQQLDDKFKNKFKNKLANKLKDMPAYNVITGLVLPKIKLRPTRFKRKKLMVNNSKKKNNVLKYRTIIRGYSSLINPKTYGLSSLRCSIRVSFNFLEESLLKNRNGSRLFPLRVCSKFLNEEKLACLNFGKLDSLSYLTKSQFPFKKRFILLRASKKTWGKKKKGRVLIRRRLLPSPAKVRFSRFRSFLPWSGSVRSISGQKLFLPSLCFSKPMYLDLIAKERVRLSILKELQVGLKQSFMASEKWRKQNAESSKYTTNPFWNNRNNSNKQHKWRDVTFGRIFMLEIDRLLHSEVIVSPSIFEREQKKHIFKGDRGSYRTRFFFGKLALCFYQTFFLIKAFLVLAESISFMNYLRFQKLIDKLRNFLAPE
jgi:hypothetical protein